jgi:hypothetical protein
MSKISSYAIDSTSNLGDKLIGTDIDNLNATKNFTIGQVLSLLSGVVLTLPTYASNSAALAGGLVQGQLYKSSTGVVSIVI